MSLGELVDETSKMADDLAPHSNARLITDYFTAQAMDEGFRYCTSCHYAPCACPDIPEKEAEMKPAEQSPEAETANTYSSPAENTLSSGTFGTSAATATASAGPAPAPAPAMGGASGGPGGGAP